jgi:catechol 2,3-dioxygenase-like lactoylglutathione lyase family enzyme
MKLEVIVLPVSDVDRAKHFYQNLGWRLDGDLRPADDFRVVQFTPPGSLASIRFGTGIKDAAPGLGVNLTLAVQDLDTTRAHLVACGVDVSDIFHGRGGFSHHTGAANRAPGPDPQHRSYFSFASFSDPDGNNWILQEIKERLPGR